MLTLTDIKKKYIIGETSQQVLKGISVQFRRNEFTSILGSSGSGKTTLLNIIGGLDHYDSGDLIIEGISTKKYKDRDWDSYRNYRVGFIFQSYNLISHQSVISNVEMALTLSGVSKKERRKKALEALEKVGLKDHIHKRPNQLSGGQMQRVAIARALVNDPEIILADEPTGALDSQTSIQIMDILKDVSKDKLVIMVTHNPELAKEYSTRIIELKDGLIVNDTNPFDEAAKVAENKTSRKTSMSLLTSLGLSFNNLLTKKGRTLLTAFAGSIGIIGIALILSLSNGVSDYVSKTERDSLSDYPISFEKNSLDLSKLFSSDKTDSSEPVTGKIVSNDDITSQISAFTGDAIKKNNLKEFKKYLDSNTVIKENVTDIQYGYNLDLQIYSTNGEDYTRINPNDFNIMNASALSGNDQSGSSMASYISVSNAPAEPVFTELLNNEEVLQSRYEILTGHLPTAYNELVLIVDKNCLISDSLLYTIGLKDRKELTGLLSQLAGQEEVKTPSVEYEYDDFLNLSYKLVLNSDYYEFKNGIWQDNQNDRAYMQKIIANGTDLKVVGVLRAKNSSTTANVFGYTHSLTEYVIGEIAKTELYKAQTSNPKINVLTGNAFDEITDTYENNARQMGIADLEDPDTIYLYPKDFDAKNTLKDCIDDYNRKQKDSGNDDLVVSYTDLIKTVINGVTSIINIISFVLIGFVAISLVVSSIMIAIITYISVLERTKEIGILRAIGASKKDISRVFKAETIIEGLIAGGLGVGIALLLGSLVNVIVAHFINVSKIANMPIGAAIFLILLSIVLNVIAGHIPSKMASKKDPVIALRSE